MPTSTPARQSTSALDVSYSSSTSAVCTIVSGQVHVVSAGSCSVTASQGGDDEYNAAPDVTRTFDVAKATLSVDAVDKSKEYGESDPALTFTLSGFKNGEDETSAGVTGDADCSLDPSAGPDVDVYTDAITCAPGTLDADNYAFVTGDKAKFTITAATLNVDAVDNSKEYGESDPALTFTLSGFKKARTRRRLG